MDTEIQIEALRLLTLEPEELRESREQRNLIKQNIADLRQQIIDLDRRKDWIQRFDHVHTLLLQYQSEAQNASRNWATHGSERNDMSLYDRLLPIRPTYDRVCCLNDILVDLRETYNEGDELLQQARAARDAAKEANDVARQRSIDARDTMKRQLTNINMGFVTEGTTHTMEKQLQQSDSILRQIQISLHEKEQSLQNIRQQQIDAMKAMEEAGTRVKALSVHSVMLGMYDLVKDKLTAMGKERTINDKLHDQQANAQREALMLKHSLKQMEDSVMVLTREFDEYSSQLLLLNQSADTALDIVRAPITRDAEESRRQLERFLDLRQKIRDREEQCRLVEMQIDAKRNQIEELRKEIAVAESHHMAIEQSMRESDNEVASLYSDLDKLITLSGWFSEWQHSPDSLRSRISELFHDWQNARNLHNEYTHNVGLLSQSLANAEKTVAEARDLELSHRNNRDALRRELEHARESLRTTFGEQKPGALQKAMSDECDLADDIYAKKHAEYLEAQNHFLICKAHQETLIQYQQDLQAILRDYNSKIDLDLESANTHGQSMLQRTVMEHIFKNDRNWVTQRETLLNEEVKKATSAARLEEIERSLTTLQCEGGVDKPTPSDVPALLLTKRHEAERQLEKQENALATIEGRIFTHERAMHKIEMLQSAKFRG